MSATYGFNLSDQDRQLFTAWSRRDPPDAWEQPRNPRIAAIQGQDNPFISQYAAKFGSSIAAAPPAASPDRACGAKTTCGQMAICAEATFYLRQCNVKSLDRGGDGIPCASLCNR
ncbi:MAG: endonuclease [Candidatus Contendobacter sp.]|nr:endonuclease [Candidatus Contendobacter sp.]